MASASPSDSPAPRRSQREKKPAKPFTSGMLLPIQTNTTSTLVAVANKSSQGKRKRTETDAEDDVPDEQLGDDANHASEDDVDDADDEEEDYRAPKPKTISKSPSKPASKPKGPRPSKKPRVTKAQVQKPTKTTMKRGRKPKEGDDAYDAEQVAKDTKIAADNPLFSVSLSTWDIIHILSSIIFRCCYEPVHCFTIDGRRLF